MTGSENITAFPERVGVVGGGRMGAGIAHAFLTAGAEVVVIERDETSCERAVHAVSAAVDASVARGTFVGAPSEALARLSVTADRSALADRTLVIEAVPEDRAVKRETLALVDSIAPSDAWIATNTSSISVSELASALRDPSRFLGLHFFNPVPASALVEIVRGEASDERLVEGARSWVERLGKTPVVVRDSPGFASSRLGVVLALEAMRMLEEGVASAADIDTAMELGYRHPLGPLRTTDLVGLDVRLGIADQLHRELGERFAAPEILRRKVAQAELGRKSGRGFFTWS